MKEGYIVRNDAGDVFGVYKTEELAIKQLKKVVKNYYGKCPEGSYDDILDFIYGDENEVTIEGEFGIKYFHENIGRKR